MRLFSARRPFFSFFSRLGILLLSLIFLFVSYQYISPTVVYAQTPTPAPSIAPSPTIAGPPDPSQVQWVFDPEVTVVGKGADRARQFLWWVLSHPGIYSVPVIAEIWAFSRNIVYVFVILVIIAFGLGLILSHKKSPLGSVFSGIVSPVLGTNITSIFFKVAILLLYVTFSYLLLLALIQTSEITMRFFIEYVGGEDLFNIIFSGSGNTEANYTSFVGYRDNNPLSLEMVKTSLLVIRITSFTYYVMAIVLVLRTIILWFLLILSPFLALLMPFVFIRNIGWIWIGVFFQWLFYGPLVALFLASLIRIWIAGIPYPFDFSRVDQPEGQIYRTAINILYGGPAQTLSPGNSANYVDTYAEYLIALVMLWASIILPWLLLRIFRDYCCEAIAAGNATLTSIFDRLRQYPTPPPPSAPAPTTTAGLAVELPFRQKIEEKVREVVRTKVEKIKEISRVNTVDIAKSMDLSVSSLSDISRVETSELKKTEVQTQLNKIAAPERISSSIERENYQKIKSELQERASSGDRVAQAILTAAENKKEELTAQVAVMSKQRAAVVPAARAKGVFAPSVPAVVSISKLREILSNPEVVSNIAVSSSLSAEKVRNVLSTISALRIINTQTLNATAVAAGLPQDKVKEVVNAAYISYAPIYAPVTITTITTSQVISQPSVIQKIAKETNLSETKVKEVLTLLPTIAIPTPKVASEIAQKASLSEAKIKEIVEATQIAVLPTVPPKKVAVPVKGVSVSIGGREVESQVSVEDYEEVKSMWLKHFREAPVPVTADIKNRSDWLVSEEKKLANISGLLSSSDPKLQHEGLEKVAEILPFMLLGGFSDAEILTYVKAKLEAAKQIQAEEEISEKAKLKAKEEIAEEEEALVEVPAKEKEEEKKEAVLAKERKMELPHEEKSEEEKKQTLPTEESSVNRSS